jgi:aspartate/methionine/tyrosine aminotransferase
MRLPEFKLERYFAPREFAARYMLSGSDSESMSVGELLALESGAEERFAELALHYTQSQGSPALRKEITGLYETIEHDDVLVFAGAEEAILAFSMVAIQPGDRVACVWPAYQSLYEIARARGAEVTLIELEEMTLWKLSLNQVESALRVGAKALFINFPHNPTGATIHRATFERIAELCRVEGTILFSDEVYRFSEHDPTTRLRGAADLGGVSLGVMSKAFGLPGLRIGWIATKDRDLLVKLAEFKDYTTICNSAPSEFLAEIALRNRDRILERNRQIALANLKLLDQFVAKHGLWVKPEAGCIAFPRLTSSEPVEDLLLVERGVLLLPGTMYDHPGNHFRIGFGRKDFVHGLEQLAQFLSTSF